MIIRVDTLWCPNQFKRGTRDIWQFQSSTFQSDFIVKNKGTAKCVPKIGTASGYTRNEYTFCSSPSCAQPCDIFSTRSMEVVGELYFPFFAFFLPKTVNSRYKLRPQTDFRFHVINALPILPGARGKFFGRYMDGDDGAYATPRSLVLWVEATSGEHTLSKSYITKNDLSIRSSVAKNRYLPL